jgi:VWFA-related protein
MKLRPVHAIALLTLICGLSVKAQVTTFKVRTEEVRIDLLVTDRGRPVTNLQETDFEVFDNGVPQEIKFLGFQQAPIDTILVLDMSASVAGDTLTNLTNAGQQFLAALKKDERAALITFSDVISLRSPLTSEVRRVHDALVQARPTGDTSLMDACFAGLMLANSKSSRPLVVVFSDGLDTFSWLPGEMVLETAKRSNAVVDAVSAGRLPDQMFLRDLTRSTGGSLFEVESPRDLSGIFLGILEEFRQRYLLTYTPRGVAARGWHDLKIRTKNRNLQIKARPGYQAAPRSP